MGTYLAIPPTPRPDGVVTDLVARRTRGREIVIVESWP